MRSFKKLAVSVLGFVLCAALLSGLIMWPYFTGRAYDYEDAEVRDSLSGSLDTLVSGASQAYVAFDPAVYDAARGTQSYNLSGSLMPMTARSFLLHEEIERNPVRTVFIELSFDTMARDRNTETPEGNLYALPRMGARLPFFRAAFRPREYPQVYADTLYRGLKSWEARLCGDPPKVSNDYRGLHLREAVDLSMDAQEFAGSHATHELNETRQPENEQLLSEMIEDCQARGIEVVIFVTPVTDRIVARYSNLSALCDWYRSFAEEKGCGYLDFNLHRERATLFPNDTAFADDNHLSPSGSAAFTAELARLAQALEEGQDVSGSFYDSYAQLDEALCEQYSH